jgi:hypothetical protein
MDIGVDYKPAYLDAWFSNRPHEKNAFLARRAEWFSKHIYPERLDEWEVEDVSHFL